MARFERSDAAMHGDDIPLAEAPSLRTGLTVDDIAHPAYMVNYSFELTWYNEAARTNVLGFDTPPFGTESRNVFLMLANESLRQPMNARRELTRLYVSLAKPRVTKAGLLGMIKRLGLDSAGSIEACYDKANVVMRKMVVDLPVVLEGRSGAVESWQVYAIYFREGILIIHVPAGQVDPNVLEFISRRDIVVHNLMRKQLPVFTPLAVLAAHLINIEQIRSVLVPGEYFELINDIWITMAPIFRKHHGTCGKHVGDGIHYFFLPQPDSDYMSNAEACACELKGAMAAIARRWQIRHAGLKELALNVSLQERRDWLGSLQSESAIEFASFRGMLNRWAKTGDTGSADSLRAIKALGAKLMAKERAGLSTVSRGAAT